MCESVQKLPSDWKNAYPDIKLGKHILFLVVANVHHWWTFGAAVVF
ncbi:hypothetical protein [Dulcicalothrix desertica]|nr:hypothetical protein [Dulcicalothrix desertica]TWH50672.1 hypothetical protein CAL7102_05003 [Dulcicalothrix desertica PCC 7102]